MEQTIKIQHTPYTNKSTTNSDSLKELPVMLLNFVNLKKIAKNERINELLQLVKDLEIGRLVSQEFKEKVFEAIWCYDCKKLKISCFECGCRICDHYFGVVREKLEVEMGAQDLENYLSVVDRIKCPECEQKISENDIRTLNSIHDEFIETCRKATITSSVQEKRKFRCFTCKKERGFYLCPGLEIHPCLHMCKICISKSYYKNKAKICTQCKGGIRFDVLVKGKHPCACCKKEFHIVGDRMIEVDTGFLLCPICGVKLLELGYSEYTDRILSLKEKVENYSYLYLECGKCHSDEFFRKCVFKACCFTYFCNKCSSSSSPCINCSR